MKYRILYLFLVLFITGCGSKSNTNAALPSGKPSTDEAQSAVMAYLNGIGCQEVALSNLSDRAETPSGLLYHGECWTFTFTAQFANMLGEQMKSDRWVACLSRDTEGKVVVQLCQDESRLAAANEGAAIAAPEIKSPIQPASFTEPAKK